MNEINENNLIKEIEQLKAENKKLKSRKKYGIVWDEEKEPEKIVLECKEKIPILNEVEENQISNGNERPINLLIEGDNYHALQVLNYTHKRKIDVIYIDPPYNTGAEDWKYNNKYVDENDTYRHSKWLSFMNNRLKIAKNLLKTSGILICTIDENEQERLGLLLEDIFPSHQKVCVTIIHNPGGIQGDNFSYCHEYAYFIFPSGGQFINLQNREDNPDIRPLRDVSKGDHLRTDAKNCFYPIFMKNENIIGFGDICDDSFHPETANIQRDDGIIEIYPIDSQGNERKWTFARQNVEEIKNELFVQYNKKRKIWDVIRKKTHFNYKTVWTDKKYNANIYGTKLLSKIIKSDFPFPKSLYNVKECLDAAAKDNKDAIVLDFFAGSGTTGHAVLDMNNNDDGSRKFILCTNNEVSVEENKKLRDMGLTPGEDQYETEGICQKICYPRIRNIITGYDFKGTEREVIWEKKIGVRELKKGKEIYDESEKIKKEEEKKDPECKITRSMSDKEGYIQLIKEKKIDGKKDGLGDNLKYFKTDFIDVENIYTISDEKKIELTYKAGEMIAIREDAFDKVEKNEWWQIFKNRNKTVAIYFREDQSKLEELFEIIKDEKSIVYLFSWGKNELKAEEYGYDNIEVKDIPQPIIEVYKEINRLNEV